jgi:hypothetical protein
MPAETTDYAVELVPLGAAFGLPDSRAGDLVAEGGSPDPDRRRPGRPHHVLPTLVALLRGSFSEPLLEPMRAREDPLSAAIGIVVGFAMGIGVWMVCGLAVWVILSISI